MEEKVIKIPSFEDVVKLYKAGEELNPLQKFIYEYTPSGYKEYMFRAKLVDLVSFIQNQ